ncbi:hypothetical protein CDAR_387401 [Caerostris darwini]|uniref:Secreted protein n=1 Tax=Caerostris darwini TaxID=1538125 RepID=A0AAV4MY94_9ARAC|nr:hypothetical protein CDAR_387401 [Caerostris darwini]
MCCWFLFEKLLAVTKADLVLMPFRADFVSKVPPWLMRVHHHERQTPTEVAPNQMLFLLTTESRGKTKSLIAIRQHTEELSKRLLWRVFAGVEERCRNQLSTRRSHFRIVCY